MLICEVWKSKLRKADGNVVQATSHVYENKRSDESSLIGPFLSCIEC